MANYNYHYKEPNFDIKEIANYNPTTGYTELSMYLDFACHTTIQTLAPSTNFNLEIIHAKNLLMEYFRGKDNIFTRQFLIRQNIDKLGKEKIKEILIANMIDKEAYNQNTQKKITINDYEDQCARYLTYATSSGQINEPINYAWINQNIETLIDCYIKMKYEKGLEARRMYNEHIAKSLHVKRAMERLSQDMNQQIAIKK